MTDNHIIYSVNKNRYSVGDTVRISKEKDGTITVSTVQKIKERDPIGKRMYLQDGTILSLTPKNPWWINSSKGLKAID